MTSEYRRGRGPNFAPIPWQLQDDERSTAYHIATYAALKRFADFGSADGSRPSDSTAARVAGCSERQLRRCRSDLRDWGWIEWESGAAAGGTNVYVIHAALEKTVGSDAEGGRPTVPGGSAYQAEGGRPTGPTTENPVPRTRTRKKKNRAATPPDAPTLELAVGDPVDPWNGAVIMDAWLQRFPDLARRLSKDERGKLGAACRRLAEGHTREDVAVAFVGMGQLFPHAEPKSEPWDPMTLEQKFPRALEAAKNHPRVRARREETALADAIKRRNAEEGFRA